MLYPHSGEGKPPMFGDYEAQRHWMEITHNLPVLSWYRHSEENDLQYWGLDYPPLTAYHSKLMGFVASKINSSWVELHTSRGEESVHHKLFMRYTVLVADLFVFIPACLLFAYWGLGGRTKSSKVIASDNLLLFCLVCFPSLILIDHGHFQYNGVSLGFFIGAVACFMKNCDLLGSILFCSSLAYKQMELYHSLPIFFYLFGKCVHLSFIGCVAKLFSLGITVLSSFSLLFLPFLSSRDDLLAVLARLFPFNRGLFEDKVANVWCSLSVVIKLKNIFSQEQLIALCGATTLMLHVPLMWHLLTRPSQRSLRYGLVISSLIFFLFSYQVHEKSILIPGISILMLADEWPFQALHFGLISAFSMCPLLLKDFLFVPMIATCAFYVVVGLILVEWNYLAQLQSVLYKASFFGFLLLGACRHFVVPPPRLPDIHVVAISTYSCFHFLIYLLFFYYNLFFPKVTKLKKI